MSEKKTHPPNLPQKTLLIIDDESGIRQLLSIFLRRYHFNILEAENGQAGLDLIKTNPIDLIILDLMLPDIYGIDLCKQIRKNFSTPILILTAAQGELNTVLGFEAGADDYLEKPFSTQVLLSRIQAILRRSDPSNRSDLSPPPQAAAKNTLAYPKDQQETLPGFINFKKAYFGPWTYDPLEKILIYNTGRQVLLTQNESLLLNILLSHPNEAVDRETLMRLFNLDPNDIESRAVDVQTSRLRNKLKDRTDTNLIQSIRNKGYALLCPIRFER